MGTNYYRKPILTEKRKEEMKTYIDEGKLLHDWEDDEEVCNSLADYIKQFDKGVHICKMSCGWLTCFDHNWGKYYKPNRASLDAFLREEGYCIVDEDGGEVPVDEFWRMVDERDKIEGAWCSKTYEEWERSRDPHWRSYPEHGDRSRCRELFGVEVDSDDFEVDGLRFAVFTDFA